MGRADPVGRSDGAGAGRAPPVRHRGHDDSPGQYDPRQPGKLTASGGRRPFGPGQSRREQVLCI